ncbi:major facilitator superfamily domain-containing protein [Trichoderma barbatum]
MAATGAKRYFTPIIQQESHSSNHSVAMMPHDRKGIDDTEHEGAEVIEKIEDDGTNMKPTKASFTPEEEKRLIRKLDFWIVPLMMVTYMLQSYDKGVMSAATQFNFNADLKLTTIVGYQPDGAPITNNQKYANASMMFYIGYLVGTYPMMFLSQRYSIPGVVSAATFLWGTVLMSTAGCFNYTGIMVNRFFLGFLESAVAPSFTVLVTFWWTREEQALRTGLWYSCVGVATAISPLINYGLGQINGSLPSWKPIFLIIGSVTVLWSVVLFFFLPDNPMTSKRLTDAERHIAIRRLERNNAGTVSHEFNKAQFFEAFRDYKLYSCSFIVLLTGVPSGALGTFGTIVIHGFGFNKLESLALTCPIGAITATSILLSGYITRRWRNMRYLLIITCGLISIAGTLICWFGPRSNRGLLFAGIFLVAVQVASGGLAVSLAASNMAGHTKKSTVSASTFVGYCVGNVIGPGLPHGQLAGSVANVTITSGGLQRYFLISIPPTYHHEIPTTAILSYHGGTRTAQSQLLLDQLTNTEFNTNSFVIYPQGIDNVWQGVPNVTVNDVQFTADILDHVQKQYCIDPTHIFATGKSDGAGMCNVLACDKTMSRRIAAFAPVSGAYYINTSPCAPDEVQIPCNPGRHDIPILAFHGGNDTTIKYQGGDRKQECLPSIPHFIQQWAVRDHLSLHNVTTPIAPSTVSYKYGSGINFGLVEHIYDAAIGHDWPSTKPNSDNQSPGRGVASFNATPIILEFFKKHPLSLLDIIAEI